MPPPEILIVAAAVYLLAGMFKGLVGVGLPMVAVGMTAALLGLAQAIQIVLIPALVLNVWQAAVGGRFLVLIRRLWPLLLATLACTWLGGWLLATQDAALLTGVLGMLLAAHALVSLVTPQIPPPGRWEPVLGPLMGGLGGVSLGAAGVYTMPAVLYLQALGLGKDELVQAMGIAFVSASVALAISLGGHGLIARDMALASALAVVPAAAGMALGQAIRRRVPAEAFRRLFFLALMALGLYLTGRALI